jgi:hypothetical protein
VPARGLMRSAPRGPGVPVDRQKDRSTRSAFNCGKWRRRAKHLALACRGKPGSGAEPMLVATGVASAAVKRRKASALRSARFCAPAGSGGDIRTVRRGGWLACAFRRFASLFSLSPGLNEVKSGIDAQASLSSPDFATLNPGYGFV